jgi:O-antigen ligase
MRSRKVFVLVVLLLISSLFYDDIIRLFIPNAMIGRFIVANSDFDTGRLGLWYKAIDIFYNSPLLGVGSGNLNEVGYRWGITPSYLQHRVGGHVESVYLSLLVSD